MRLSKTIRGISRMRKAAAAFTPSQGSGRLKPLPAFGSNPGDLDAYFYMPEGAEGRVPLVVVLHGCTQDAPGYDRGSGWSQLADRHGFALLFPEQKRSNNPNLCFNWYQPQDAGRGKGEAASIRAMIAAMAGTHPIDGERIFVTGLSAGGAMASVMLAAYPELFAGGAIIAGLPFGCASGLAEAFGCMGGRGDAEADVLAERVRDASAHKGPWPRVSVWHGSADHVVSPDNGESIVRQWTALHGLAEAPARTETVDGYPRRVWLGPDGEVAVEHWSVTGMGHGTPLDPGTGEGESGVAMPHMLDVGLSSTDRIAAFFGIAGEPKRAERKAGKATASPAPSPPRRRAAAPAGKARAAAGGVQKVIEDALKAAGLMR